MKKNFFKNLVIAIAMLILCYVSASAKFGGGVGAKTDPFKMSNISHLTELANDVRSGTTYSGMYFKLLGSITGVSTAIGTTVGGVDRPFCGNFDGNNITNSYSITVSMTNANSTDVGLFGLIGGGAVIQNLTVYGNVLGAARVGGIIGARRGYGAEVIIHKCKSYVNIPYSSTTDGYRGGIIGGIWGATTIECCDNYGDITGIWCVGGIAGNIDNDCRITRCTNTGEIRGNCDKTGGIVGLGAGTSNGTAWNVKACLNSGWVSAPTDVGGIMGMNAIRGEISECLNTTTLDGQSFAGAIIGNISVAAYTGISNCVYDKLTTSAHKGIGAENVIHESDNGTIGKITSSIYGNTGGLSSTYWAAVSGSYPRVVKCPDTFRGKLTTEITDVATSACGTFSVSEVMPNIVKEGARLKINAGEAGNLHVSIYDMAGLKIADIADEYANENSETSIYMNNLSLLSAGVYNIVVSVGNDRVARKFVKQ